MRWLTGKNSTLRVTTQVMRAASTDSKAQLVEPKL